MDEYNTILIAKVINPYTGQWGVQEFDAGRVEDVEGLACWLAEAMSEQEKRNTIIFFANITT